MTHPGQSDFKTRLRDELAELHERVQKLCAFIDYSGSGYDSLDPEEQLRLCEQRRAMQTYEQILAERCDALGVER